MNDEDPYLIKLLSTTPHKQEALLWLKQKDGRERTIGDGSQDEAASLQLVEDLYQRGATHVTAIDIQSDPHSETTSTLIVGLPQEKPSRSRIFQIEAKVAATGGFDPVTDQGQKYLMLHW